MKDTSDGLPRTLKRLRELEAAANRHDCDDGEAGQLIAEMRNALPKLLAVAEAVQRVNLILEWETFKPIADALAALEDK